MMDTVGKQGCEGGEIAMIKGGGFQTWLARSSIGRSRRMAAGAPVTIFGLAAAYATARLLRLGRWSR